MLLYKYDKITNEYIGSFPAYLDPLESQLQGRDVIAIPPCSTLVVPPDFKEGEIPVFNKETETWKVEKDFRGTIGYNKKTGEQIHIITIGELPKEFTLEKPVLLADLKLEKLKELSLTFAEEQSKEVEFEGVCESSESVSKFIGMLNGMGELKFTTYFTKDEKAISLTKEKLEKIIKFFSLRNILLPIIRAEIAKTIRACRSKKTLEELELDFKLEDRINELISCSTEEINSYIEENTK